MIKQGVSNYQDRMNWRFLSFLVAGLFLLIFLWWGVREIQKPSVFPIKHVRVAGSFEHVSQPAAEKAIAPLLQGKGIFGVHTRALQAELSALSPWVDSVSVHRGWPLGNLVITFTEKQPIAYWGNNLMTARGDVFQVPLNQIPKNLVQFSGPPGQEQMMMQYYAAFAHIIASLPLTITGVALLSPDHSWELTLSTGAVVKLGHGKNVLPKLRRFVQDYALIFKGQNSPAKTIDLRYHDGMAIRWGNAPAPASPAPAVEKKGHMK